VTTKKSSKTKKSGEPQTMEELLARYGKSSKTFSKGSKVKGRVIEKRAKSLVLDIGGKSEGLVAEKAFQEARNFIEKLNVGDEVEASVLVPETPDGYTILSLRDSAGDATWKKLEDAKKEAKALRVTVRKVLSSGLMVEYQGITAFIPKSQLGKEASKRLDELVDKTLKVGVVELDRNKNRIVLSEKAISEGEDIRLRKEAVKAFKEGDILKGKVTTVADFGCFVEVEKKVEGKEVKVEGLVHISELSWEKVAKPQEIVKEGDKVEVKVIGLRDGKLALSMKQAEKDPWDNVEKKYKPEAKIKGKVVKVSDFGVFVQLEPGVEGLIHITKIPPDKKLKIGDSVTAIVEEVDKKDRKISLGLMLTAKPVGYK
jgi:ribosomal protein S1